MATEEVLVVSDTSPPTTLPSIQTRIRQLLSRLPTRDETLLLDTKKVDELEAWCRRVRGILRQYNLVLNFLSVVTYQWEPDRPGHTGQSLSALNSQMQSGTARVNILQNDISRVLTPSLTRQLIKKKMVVHKNKQSTDAEVEEIREETYEYEQVVNDPEMLQLNREQVVDEAVYKLQLVVSVMEQMCQCIDDYRKAEAGAGGSDGRGYSMAY